MAHPDPLPHKTDTDSDILEKITDNLGGDARWIDSLQSKKALAAKSILDKLSELEARQDAEPIDSSKSYSEGEIVYAEGASWRVAAGGADAGDLPSTHPDKFTVLSSITQADLDSKQDLIPFTITNTGGASIQSDDGIPKLYDWDDISNSGMGIPEFYSSTNLTDLILGSKVTSIAEGEFFGCTNLAGTLVIPDACITISVDLGFGVGAFEGSTGIEKLVCGSGLNLIFNQSFNGCTSLATVLLNEGLTELGSNAFNSCAITTIDLPSTITDMGSQCFENCSSLATVNCYATTAPTLTGSNHFQSISATQIHVPVGATGYGTTFAGLTVVADL